MSKSCDQDTEWWPADAALDALLADVAPLRESASCPLMDALGGVTAAPIYSPLAWPRADTSAMDGYAVNAADLADLPCRLPLSQRIAAGMAPAPHTAGTAARLFTGAWLPPGADTVVIQEDCTADKGYVTFTTSVQRGAHVRAAGSEIAAGAMIFPAGQRLRAQEIGLAAACGLATLPLVRRVRVAIFATGDELREPGTPLSPGKIYNANRYTLSALLRGWGCEVIDYGLVADRLTDTIDALRAAANDADVVITSGGVSVGEEDHITAAVAALGHLKVWRIAIKPGKPLAYGRLGDTPYFGLPGNPASLLVTGCLFVRPYLLRLRGVQAVTPPVYFLPAGFTWPKASPRREYLRARCEQGQVTLHAHQGSASLFAASWAEGLVCVPENTPVHRGDRVAYLPFAELLA